MPSIRRFQIHDMFLALGFVGQNRLRRYRIRLTVLVCESLRKAIGADAGPVVQVSQFLGVDNQFGKKRASIAKDSKFKARLQAASNSPSSSLLALVDRNPMQSARAASRVKYIAVPKWPELRTATAPIPFSLARSSASARYACARFSASLAFNRFPLASP